MSNSMNNLSSYCWLVDAKIRLSGKDLPVPRFGHFLMPARQVLQGCLVSRTGSSTT